MADTSFALSADLFVLHQAGIRELLPAGKMLEGEKFLGREPWAGFLAKAPPAPLMVWTYRELGADLSGRADPARGALWRELIKRLDLPRGSVAFWPFALPTDGGSDVVHKEPFLAGLARIAPKALVVFEERAFRRIAEALAATDNDMLGRIRCFSMELRNAAGAIRPADDLAESLRQFLKDMVPDEAA